MLTIPNNEESIAQDALLRAELKALTEETIAMNKYRDYFEGDQALVYSTELFTQVFGTAFEGFSDNWVKVIINSVNDRLELLSFDFDKDEKFERSDEIWDVLRKNEINEQQIDLHEGVLIEGRAFIIVWPDDEIGATVDWQPGQICRVFYDPDRRTQALWAVRRWTTEHGEVYVTFYTPDAVVKFVDKNASSLSAKRPSSSSALTEIPGVGFFGNLVRRDVPDEAWPLPNPFGRVPVVEFNNTSYRSEIKDAIPQQDALNKMLLDMLVTGEFQGFPQRAVETMSSEPEGGWASGPGEVWQFTPAFDSDGKHIPVQFFDFDVADPSTYMQPIAMWLQHMALTSSTPVRYFMQSDRGGRGDAPSGDSLLVDDKPLNDKVEAKQKRLGNRWMEVARLIGQAIEMEGAATMMGKAVWRDPRHDYRLSRLKEGFEMIQIGLPVEFVATQIGLTPAELKTVLEMIEVEKAEREAKEKAELDAQTSANTQSNTQPKPSANSDS